MASGRAPQDLQSCGAADVGDLRGEDHRDESKNAKRRGAEPAALAGSIATLTDGDRAFLTSWFAFHTIAPEVFDIAEMLCEPGLAEELDEIFDDSRGE